MDVVVSLLLCFELTQTIFPSLPNLPDINDRELNFENYIWGTVQVKKYESIDKCIAISKPNISDPSHGEPCPSLCALS